jgi:hypothetical protein
MSQADYPNFYTDEEGNKYIPVEATINAMPVTTNVVSHDGDIVTTSTTYERTPTV